MVLIYLTAIMMGFFLQPHTATPVLPGKVDIAQIAAGETHTCFLSSDGFIFCVGGNHHGQCAGERRLNFFGSTFESQYVPDFSRVHLGTGRTATQVVAGGYHNCVPLDNNRVKCFGHNNYGQLGLGDTDTRGDEAGEMGDNLPYVDFGTGRTVKHISSGRFHTCMILDNDLVKCFGLNDYGQLGLGDTDNRGNEAGEMGDNLPHVDLGTGRTVKQISAGRHHTCVVLDNDGVKCFGLNKFGQLGLGDVLNRGDQEGEMGDSLPYIDLGTGRSAKQVVVGFYHTCVLLDNDGVKCFGMNEYGQLGLGDTNNRGDEAGEMGDNLPYLDFGTGRTVKYISAGKIHTCALLDNDRVKCFGWNDLGWLGLGDSQDRGDEIGEMGDKLPYVDLGIERTIKLFFSGGYHNCALLDNNGVKCFGWNHFGQLGLGDTRDRGDQKGQMGDNLPYVEFGIGRTVKSISCGDSHTCVLLDNNGVKCFGKNLHGRLGFGDDEHRGDEVREMGDRLPYIDFGTGRSVKRILGGEYHTCVLLDNDGVKCFGNNGGGQLGYGRNDHRGDQVGEMGDNLPYLDFGTGRTVKHISAGRGHTCVLLDNGGMKCFGWNNYGQLGLGDTNNRGDKENQMGDSLPYIDIGTGRTVKRISAGGYHTCVLLDNDLVKCFGRNEHGHLGLGDTQHHGDEADEMGDNLPYVDFGTGRTVKHISAGTSHTCALLDNDRVKCFGWNDYGSLGLGDRLNRGDEEGEMGDNLPYVDVGTGRTVKLVFAGDYHTCVILDNNRVKCFGLNSYGGLGLGDTTRRGSQPGEMGDDLPYVDVGIGRTVKRIIAGYAHTCFLLDNGGAKCVGWNYYGQLGLGDSRDRASLDLWPIDVGFHNRCQPGFKFSHSKLACTSCPVGEYQPLMNQETCLACSVGRYQNTTESTSCNLCSAGTFQSIMGSAVCNECDIGTYEDEIGSIRCKPCPSQRTTIRKGQYSVDACVAASGFMEVPTSTNGIDIQTCDEIIGVDCSSPGATLETIPLKCGFWRPNPNTTDDIQVCLGGCDACKGGDNGTFSSTLIESTKYCALGYIGPRCTLCADGFADVFKNGTCTFCDSFNKQFAVSSLLVEGFGWAFVVLVLTVMFVYGNRYLNESEKESIETGKEEEMEVDEERSWLGLNLNLKTVVFIAVPIGLSAMSFYQVIAAYTGEFQNLNHFWEFDVDGFSTVLVSHRCEWDPTFRDRLLLHANVPVFLGLWVLSVTFAMNKVSCFAKSENAKSENSAHASLAAMFFVVLAYPGVERRAVGAFVCEKFVGYDGKVERLLSADLRVDCDSQDHLVTEGIAVVYILLYTFLVPGVFLFAWLQRDGDEYLALEKAKRLLFASYRKRGRVDGNKRSMGWFLAYDTVRKFFQASLIVFFEQGTLSQIQVSSLLNAAAIAILCTCHPFRLGGTNAAMFFQLFYLLLVCATVGSTDIATPLGRKRGEFVFVIAAILVPLTSLMCWMYNLWVLEKALRAVQEAMESSDMQHLDAAVQKAKQLGLKTEQERVLSRAEQSLKKNAGPAEVEGEYDIEREHEERVESVTVA